MCSSRLWPFLLSPGGVNPAYKVRDGEMCFGSEGDQMLSDSAQYSDSAQIPFSTMTCMISELYVTV